MAETATPERATLEREAQFEARIGHLLAAFGHRVRDARKGAGLSRRELSEASGVSQRYIAQIEGGEGNISIALLMRIADALGADMADLVAGGERVAEPKAGTIAALLASASAEQLLCVRQILEPSHGGGQRARRIALIGLRGAGKSTLGKMAAERLGLAFVELNDEIEQASGMAVNEVIALYGQEGYRHLERGALDRVADAHDDLVLAVAGGIVSNRSTFEELLRRYHTVWLKALPEDHMARVHAQGDLRPMAGNPDAMGQLRKILTGREALYARAGAAIDTSGRTLEESLGDLLDAIEEHQFLGY